MNPLTARRPGLLRPRVLGTAILCLLPLAARAEPEFPDPKRYMDVREVQPGMSGYGRTVFQGTKVQEFRFEVIGVLRNYRPAQSVILIRTRHRVLDKAGIIAGMSGSPIYIRDRLVGAVAYTWAFEKQAIAGVTPITDMLKLVRDGLRDTSTVPAAGNTSRLELPTRAIEGYGHLASAVGAQRLGEAMTMFPIQTPVSLSGFPPSVQQWFQDTVDVPGLLFVPGGAAGSESPGSTAKGLKVEPGSAASVDLISGDLSASAVGTVTDVIGDRIIAFGHPFLGLGTTDLPLSLGYVHGVLPSLALSFKFASSVKSIGRITDDGVSGIAGRLGDAPPAMQVAVEVSQARTGQTGTFQYRVLRHPKLTGSLAASVIMSSALSRDALPSEATLFLRAKIAAGGARTFNLANTYSSARPLSALAALSRDIGIRIEMLMDNEFESIPVESVDAAVQIEPRRTTADVVAVRPSAKEVSPGETMTVAIDLIPFQQPLQTLSLSLQVPETISEGMATLQVLDAQARVVSDRRDRPYRFQPRTLDQLLELLKPDDDSQAICVRLVVPGSGLAIHGVELPSLPPSNFAALFPPNTSGPSVVRPFVETRHKTSWVVKCDQRLMLSIRRRP